MPPLDKDFFRGSSLCVVGNINRDLKTSPITPGDDLFQDGETSVASITETIGGGGANSACAAAALGARVSFCGKIGADSLGARLERTLARHGISAHLRRDEANPSGNSIALTFDTGNRHFISSLPANRSLAVTDLDLGIISGHDHLLRADIWFSEPMLFGGNETLFRAAHNQGIAVSIDLNWDPHWGRAGVREIRARKEAVRAVLPLVDVAHGNARELMEFAAAPDLESALKQLLNWGVKAVVVHLGAKGAGYCDGARLLIEPPTSVERIVNSTGTGDVLSVCMMLLQRCNDIPILKRLKLSNAIVAEFMEGRRQLIPELSD